MTLVTITMERRFEESLCESKWPAADPEAEEVGAVASVTIAINLVTLLGSARIRVVVVVVVEVAVVTLVRHPVVDTLLRRRAVDTLPRPLEEADEAIRHPAAEEAPEAILDRPHGEALAHVGGVPHLFVVAVAPLRHTDDHAARAHTDAEKRYYCPLQSVHRRAYTSNHALKYELIIARFLSQFVASHPSNSVHFEGVGVF